ncbi:uncharacterized protein PFL1_01184 [Pseudozyma flocculosa PF-1]|uniref:uncharacterized protein n=1 Tax=Pseudozyma flocculosa PF-1 TaxID=1277687 RepID=UPI000456102F|nr:uncharacterized protein PFL1_01184 [Pseudozyma flocculosa PF-1]EPQ30995.1 hypothetical protein PFL1_01184 [Pseudozyma flocculosa PF-1]
MPRIPVRVEPYSSPSRQHRHYKNKRDQVLRALGKAAYINGSHFAIMWVSARGDVETYASEALQSRLDDWFVKGGIAEEAKDLVTGTTNHSEASPSNEGESSGLRRGELSDGGEDDDDEQYEDDDSPDQRASPSPERHAFQLSATASDDPFLDSSSTAGKRSAAGSSKLERAFRSHRKAIAPLDTGMANNLYLRSKEGANDGGEGATNTRRGSLAVATANLGELAQPPKSAPLPSNEFRDALLSGPRTSTPHQSRLGLSRTASNSHPPQFEIRLENEASRTAFLELRFGQLQQGVCKTVAKAWIKIIEPKKQTRCPYNKGEEGKPSWWPDGVRHKEPDHLMKPERHSLLLTILRSPKVQVARLQLATAEVVALIKADKVSLLMDVYRIAREEEKMREAKVDMDTPMTVGVSTLDGWSESEQGPTSDGLHIARSVSPEPNEKASVGISARKRTLAQTTMARSASTSAVSANKRRSIAVPSDAAGPQVPGRGGETMARTASASNLSTSACGPTERPVEASSTQRDQQQQQQHQQQQQQQQQQANAHAASVAASMAAASGAGVSTQYDQASGYQQVHGLVTPLTGSAQLMDPAYMAAATSHAGDLSQPPYPYPLFYGAHDVQAGRASQGALFGYPDMGQPAHPGVHPQTLGSATALGLHDVPVPNDQHGWSSVAGLPMHAHHLSNVDLGDLSQAQWSGHGTPSGPSVGEASFNTSFDSSGPRTPSPVDGQLRLNLGAGHDNHHHHQHPPHPQQPSSQHHHQNAGKRAEGALAQYGVPGLESMHGMMQDQNAVNFDAWVRSQAMQQQQQQQQQPQPQQ